MIRHAAAGALCLLIMGCAAAPSVTSKVDAAVVALTLAENTYVAVCKSAPKVSMCVEPMKQKIKDADQKAYDAVKAAEANEALLSAALDAIAAFSAVAK